MNFSKYLDQSSEPYAPSGYPPPQCWGKISPGKVLSALRAPGAAPAGIMLKLAFPLCGAKCSFCDFSVSPDRELLEKYPRAITSEMKLMRGLFAGRSFFSLRLGGNPFALAPAQLDRVFAAASADFKFTRDHKSGIELNPAYITVEKLKLAAGYGIQWAILGVQSRDRAVLSGARCAHQDVDLEKKYELLKNSGIKYVSMDLMFGLPLQTTESFIRDVLALVKMRPERIAIYRFSGFKASKRELDYIISKGFGLMEKAGYIFQKKHDPYWGVLDLKHDMSWPHAYETGNPVNAYSILSLGVGARSYLWGRVRYQNKRDVRAYMRSLGAGLLPAEAGSVMSVRDEMVNYMLLSFDCLTEIRTADFRARFGVELDAVFGRQFKALRKAGIVQPGPGGYKILGGHDLARPAARGVFFPPELVKLLNERGRSWVMPARG